MTDQIPPPVSAMSAPDEKGTSIAPESDPSLQPQSESKTGEDVGPNAVPSVGTPAPTQNDSSGTVQTPAAVPAPASGSVSPGDEVADMEKDEPDISAEEDTADMEEDVPADGAGPDDSEWNPGKTGTPEVTEGSTRRSARARKSRLIMVDGHAVLKLNNYDLNSGEMSVFDSELDDTAQEPGPA
eukprot:CAMPEP_0118954064 /NCGR_PEP_ID=MMETSP1169-20130426/57644_1 /TAXON_ID=36882 /ORGANISM="Pyramimonas obovata, Strain CCMP722" /LENGTH=183 /DNA_ID=CAMNT_0006901637 /DNA_START=258 /DNA_END=806 /DNA_ORIENTATION=-